MINSGIKLSDRNFIAEPSGRKIGPKDLVEGGYYLYEKMYKYRLITEIKGDDVYYHDKIGTGLCSKQHFVTKCPNEATPEEIAFIDRTWNL